MNPKINTIGDRLGFTNKDAKKDNLQQIVIHGTTHQTGTISIFYFLSTFFLLSFYFYGQQAHDFWFDFNFSSKILEEKERVHSLRKKSEEEKLN